MTFEYGGLQIHYCSQNPNGSLMAEQAGGWNRVLNISDVSLDDRCNAASAARSFAWTPESCYGPAMPAPRWSS